jgi:hypothetical protein
MNKTLLYSFIFLLATLTTAGVSGGQNALDERYDAARLSWDTGNYIRALEEFEAILKSPDGGRFFEPIALLTGELFKTTEVAKDGRSVRISPDGLYAAYETGQRQLLVTPVVSLADPTKTVTEIRGTNFVFSPSTNAAAFLRVTDTPEITALRKEVEALSSQATTDRQALTAKQRQLAWLEAKNADLIFYDIATKKERRQKIEGFLKSSPVFSADGHEVYFVGAKEADTASNEIYALSEKGAVRPLTSGTGFKTNPVVVPGGKYVLYTAAPQTPFPKPQAQAPTQPAAPGQAQAAGAQGARGGGPPTGQGPRGGGPGGAPRQFAVLALADGTIKTFTGSSPAVSTNGTTLVFVGQDGTDSTLNLVKLEGPLTPAVIKKTSERIGSASPASDGSSVVFDMTYTRNGEIFYIKSDGKGEVRLSREIEPDRAPRFLNQNQVLAIKGELRYSRVYVYDLKTLGNVRIFHNNTLRTISPEYEWVADPTGTKLLIVSERDGDTISGKRGVYVVDLAKKISADDLFARLIENLSAEKALRAWGETTFAPIRSAVQAAVDRVSISKIYDYEEALFNFDSKYYTLPANKLAADYIYAQLKSFGYAPELQSFETRGSKTANVLATLTGTENPDLVVVLGAHFDSVQRGPGADDNTSSVAINLETARLLAKMPLPCTVVFAFFTAEEAGELGSREYIRLAKENQRKIAAVLNNDMIGWANDFRLDDTIRFASYGLRDIQHAAAFLFSKLVTYDTHYVRSTDGAPFYDAYGSIVSGLGSYPVLGNPYYHQPTDLLETVNHQLLVEAAKFNIASVMMVASSPTPVQGLKVVDLKSDTAEVVWTASPEKGIASYVIEFGPDKDPRASRLTLQEPRAKLAGFKLKKGETLTVAVKAVDARGIQSWDWARTAAAVK